MKWRAACSPIQGPKEGCGLREVAAELQLAAAGPVEAVEGSLHQGCHDAAQAGLIRTAVPLTVMLHAEPRGQGEREERLQSYPGSPPLRRQAGGPATGNPACPDQASDCLVASVSQPRSGEDRPSGWKLRPHSPSIEPDSFFPKSLAPVVLYSWTLCPLCEPHPHLRSFQGQLKPHSCLRAPSLATQPLG